MDLSVGRKPVVEKGVGRKLRGWRAGMPGKKDSSFSEEKEAKRLLDG
jgi:hypothetical protein